MVFCMAELTFRKSDYPGRSNLIAGTLKSRELCLADEFHGRRRISYTNAGSTMEGSCDEECRWSREAESSLG